MDTTISEASLDLSLAWARLDLEESLACWKRAEQAAIDASQAMWAVGPLDPVRDELRAKRDLALERERDMANEYRKMAEAYRARAALRR